MKKLLFVGAFSALCVLGTACSGDKKSPAGTVAEAAGLSTEQKVDEYMNNFMGKMKAAIAEQDDKTAIEMLNKLSEETAAQEQTLKAEVESWKKSLSETEQEAFDERTENKPYMKAAFDMLADPALLQRLEKNPKFREAFEKANSASTLFSDSDDAE